MKIAPLAEVKANFSEYINECKNGTIVVTKNGRATAALIPILDDDDLERILLSNSKILNKILDSAEKRIKSGHGIKHEDLWKQLENDISNPNKKAG